MSLTEFDIIERYFRHPGLAAHPDEHVVLGIGDDAALIRLTAEQELVLSLDVLLPDVHFPPDADPNLIAQRALSVNLSDLAAMGAEPVGFTLGLTLPQVDETWLDAFAKGLRRTAQRYHCGLLGGNLSRGPLSIAIQVQGVVPQGQALLRSGAKAGDIVAVAGMIGGASAGLRVVRNKVTAELSAEEKEALLQAYYQPEPQLAAGILLREYAHAAIDISDGLLADLGHIAEASAVRIEVGQEQVPVSAATQKVLREEGMLDALNGSDDYALAFTLAPAQWPLLQERAKAQGLAVTQIGTIVEGSGCVCIDADGHIVSNSDGYRHF